MEHPVASSETLSNEQLTLRLLALLRQEVDLDQDELILWQSWGERSGEAGELDLSFVPPDKKVVVSSEHSAQFQLLFMKTDGYDPRPFEMSDGYLEAGQPCTVRAVSRTENRDKPQVLVALGYHFFYTDTLAGLEFAVVDKTPAELAQAQLRGFGQKVSAYETAKRAFGPSVHWVAEELAGELPVFLLDSSYRYKIDLFFGGSLYRLDEAGLHVLRQFGSLSGDEVHGLFVGNRIAAIGGEIVVVDDVTGLAVGRYYHEEQQHSFGFGYLGTLDLKETLSERIRNADLLARPAA